MDIEFFDSLFEGDSVCGTKFCMGLTGGDFWARKAGCAVLYRGVEILSDLKHIIAVADYNAQQIEVPSINEHQSGVNYYYRLNRVNICGEREKTQTACLKFEV